MSQAIKNALNAFAYYKVSAMLEEGRCVTPSLLDQWEVELSIQPERAAYAALSKHFWSLPPEEAI